MTAWSQADAKSLAEWLTQHVWHVLPALPNRRGQLSYSDLLWGAVAVALGPGVWLWASNPCPLLSPQPLPQLLCTIQLWAKPIQANSAGSGGLTSQ